MSLTLNTKVYPFTGFIMGRIAQYLNAGAGSANGFKTATAVVDAVADAKGQIKVRWKLKLPTVVSDAACDCPGGVVRENFADIVVTVNRAALAAERSDLALSLKDLVASAEFQQSITNLQTPSA